MEGSCTCGAEMTRPSRTMPKASVAPSLVVERRGQIGESLGALLGEAHVHDVVAGGLPGRGDVGSHAGILDRGTGDDLGAQEVLGGAVRVAGDHGFVGGCLGDLLLLSPRIHAVRCHQLGLELGGEPVHGPGRVGQLTVRRGRRWGHRRIRAGQSVELVLGGVCRSLGGLPRRPVLTIGTLAAGIRAAPSVGGHRLLRPLRGDDTEHRPERHGGRLTDRLGGLLVELTRDVDDDVGSRPGR